MYRSSSLRSTLNAGYITGLGMCKECPEAVHCVALSKRTWVKKRKNTTAVLGPLAKTSSDIWTFGFQGPQQPKSLQSRWQFQMSHIDMICPSAGFCSFIGAHTLSLAEMLRLASGHSCSSSQVTTALISCLQVILDPWPAIRNLYKEMKFCRTLQNLLSLKGQLSVNESKLNHNGPLHSGQIVQLAVKSYLRLTGCDGQKWYMVTIVETATLLLQSCLHDAKVAINRRKPALRNIKLLVGSEGSDVLK